MKKWGLVVTLLYAVIVLGLLAPVFLLLAANPTPDLAKFKELYQQWGLWIIAGVFILIQFTLLSLSVDTSQKRMRSRTPIVISAVTTGFLLMIVTAVVAFASTVVVTGEAGFPDLGGRGLIFAIIGGLWIVWGVLFYLLYRNATDPVTHALSWLFRGSVLELLVAVPSHVIVRRRHDCCAPGVTAFGITSGIAIMLLSFGPSVLLLFKKRMEKYSVRGTENK
ncbi:MAG TPA: hypothetical protein VE377_15480 [Candidatus Dormibacteraeota bacterium]|nr:hypothetical protein [Candidatus Dormibacteraeota bacterium]